MLRFNRSTQRYESVADEQAALRIMIRDLALARVSYGYRRIHVLLQREGWAVNPSTGTSTSSVRRSGHRHKRVYRLYREEGLLMRPRKPRRHVCGRNRIGEAEGHRTE